MKKKSIINISDYYLKKAEMDKKSADILVGEGLYSQAIYFAIQYMEKLIKSEISKIFDIKNKYTHDLVNIHSIKDLIFFLIDIKIPDRDKNFKNQIKIQIEEILGKIDYNRLHNNLRYPFYSSKTKEFVSVEYNEKDYDQIVNISFKQLKKYIDDLYKIN